MTASSPRLRRLQSDLKAMQQLRSESSILHFTAHGELPEAYTIYFLGRGMMRQENNGPIEMQERHEVHIRLGAGYPRMMPEIRWKSPIFHPNISGNGSVCLGGYGTYWVPSLTLDELCHMLWDMIRYENYDETSPYNREAALWAKTQSEFRLPLDERPLRDRLAGYEPEERSELVEATFADSRAGETRPAAPPPPPLPEVTQAPNGRWHYSPQTGSRVQPLYPQQPAAVRPAVPPVVRTPLRTARPAPAAAADDGGVIFLDSEAAPAPTRTASDSDIMFIQ
ncbi:ubiquitin-conjugating enzyme E2 [Anatilimnocola floriformis]|uniref:ubiquitin-conjugating enzyme E2 n=1 Tax=Anatilimnocola floriformis TaxID=2948575 RepID=UPI0020C57B22|nr:ubiquitin-conjugating enzyme E2 [Anatilimnocola floriformis]